ncbi:DUF6057 family protein [Parabacteroides sp. PF5-9]|uniref:DUF6057 family protein n=1 Tax=Parabacteroides sp. PF5-9 TaxID=1742404 RepID=UPI0024763126|nr:DUF6057 family protein [Parabacteroides sp. PF5-9]MDH6356598.1 hypothetical protein [Parabacteroides sp. PF5-9]
MKREQPDRYNQDLFIAIILAVSCFSFFQFFFKYHLFFKEEIQLFLFTTDYFLSYLKKPGWLAAYLGDFLTQFFYLRGGGAVLISLILLLEWRLIVRWLRSLGLYSHTSLFALFPIVIEWVLHTTLGYSLTSSVGFIFVLATCLLLGNVVGKWWSYVLIVCTIPLFYALIGGYMLFLPVYLLLNDLSKQKGIVFADILLIVLFAVYPYIVRSYYVITVRQAYLLPGMSRTVYYSGLALLFISWTVFFKFTHTHTFRRKALWPLIIGLFLLLGAGLWQKADFRQEKILSLSVEGYFNRWDKVYQLATENELSNTLASYYTNIALSKSGRLPDELLNFYQPASQALFLPLHTATPWIWIFSGSDVFFHIGDMNMAQHAAMLGQIFSPNHRSSRMVKRLAEVNLVNGDSTATLKYLRMLDQTLFHRDWAIRRKEMLTDSTNTWLQDKRKQIAVHDTLRLAGDDMTSLKLLIESNSENKEALDYLLCYCLVNKDIRSFVDIFDQYCKGQQLRMPALYGEALLIHLAVSKASQEELESYKIPANFVTDFMAYTRAYEQYGAQMEPLREKYGKTYCFYYHFAQMKNE